MSAWLRGIADKYQSEDGFGCREIVEMLGFCCDDVEMCNKCRVKAMRVIADRIDAERALPEGVEWPRFEDGGLVRIGDELEFEGKTMLVCDATFYADGVPIKVGDTVWATYNGCKHIVMAVCSDGSLHPEMVTDDGCMVEYEEGLWDFAKKVTHEQPDSWILWGEDLDMAVKAGEVDKVEMMRRAKKLAKAGEVE
ncbi:hypothetical protein [Ellagibacter isourolithinifaciens]|uniref:hypothetical protein n=1 Tax=Ellagibacter isourolithinifaciens TaxID=2137581 RepID=UPI003AF06092